MKKQGRNDSCACGSGKKYKRCCGKNNVLAFNPSLYDDELELLHGQFIDFALEHFEVELKDIVHRFATDYINTDDEKEIETYTQLIFVWALFTIHVRDDKTVFDIFYTKVISKIKYPSVKQTLAKWTDMHPGVFEVFPNGENVRLIDIVTDKAFDTSIDAELEYEFGNLAIGCLVPYTGTHEFFMLMIQIPGTYLGRILELIDEKIQGDLTIKEVFPHFLGDVLQLTSEPLEEWGHIDHEIVASIFQKHATEKGFDKKSIQMTVQFWSDYCGMNYPIIRKHEGYAAALDYFMQVEMMFVYNVTQKQLAEEYGTSAGTISNHYRRFSDDFNMLNSRFGQGKLPHFNAEKEMRNLMNLIGEQEFESEEDLNHFMQGIMNLDDILPSENPRDIAQDILFDARETSGVARRKLINKALDIYPHSPDAYLLLVEDERNIDKRMELLEKAIDVGEKDLGVEFFAKNKGHFWGLVETRPFMRAKEMYASYLESVGFIEEAMDVYKELLALNPNDNQGIRYLLLTLYLELAEHESANALIKEYDKVTASFMFSKALLHYEQHGKTKKGLTLLKEAVANNPFVGDYLLGHKIIPSEKSDYIGLGDETEAIAYAQENAHLWADAGEFLKSAWLSNNSDNSNLFE